METAATGDSRRCVIVGAYGLIGSAVARAFLREGWTVIGAGRDTALGRRLLPGIEWVSIDFNKPVDSHEWRERLSGCDTLVNCAGILQSGRRDKAQAIHVDGPSALYDAAEQAGVRRLIHVSAMSAEVEIDTEYTETKLAAERNVAARALDWLILKPSLVVGEGSYGGTAMVRGLAGIPLLTPLPGDGRQVFQPIALTDLGEGIVRLTDAGAPSRTTLYAPGPETRTLSEIVAGTQDWLGLKRTRQLAVGKSITKAMLALGDLWVQLGNRTALCTTSYKHMSYSETIDHRPFADATGLALKTFEEAMADTPATVQDRLHARISWAGFAVRLLLSLQLLFGGSAVEKALPEAFQWGVWAAELCSGLLLLFDRWVRAGCFLLIATVLLSLPVAMISLITLPLDFAWLALRSLFIVSVAAVVMALAEKR